jgi:hypothetical protein
MRGCPFPCKGYTPAPESTRPEQEVHLLGGDWWRAQVCPGAVVARDAVVDDLLSDYQTLEVWCKGNTLEWFRAQPQWWTAGLREAKRMYDTVDAEARENR